MATMAHHLLAKATTDAVLANFKAGTWTYGSGWGKDFLRTGTPADFPSPDAAFFDKTNKKLVYFEFKPDTETKRGILTGVGQSIAYLENCSLSYLVAPQKLAGYNLEGYLTDLYKHQLTTIPSGLIIYDNSNPKNVRLIQNVKALSGKSAKKVKVQFERYWAKHQDLPIPLFHLILHYYYLKKVGIISGDAFQVLFEEKLVPKSVLTTLTPVTVQDVEGDNIKTLAGRKDIVHGEKKLAKYRKAPSPAALKVLADDFSPATPGDTYYSSIRKNYMTFVKQMQMIDSAGNLTDRGLALYQLGLVNGPKSKIFTDYFIREVLTTGHHLDVLLDLDEMQKSMPGASINSVLSALEASYATRGLLKSNPKRIVGTSSTVDFLKYEKILWPVLGLIDRSFNIQWRKITEICSLPDIM